jgi:hypothetical protein
LPNRIDERQAALTDTAALSGTTQKTYQTRAMFSLIRKDDRAFFFEVGVDRQGSDIEVSRYPQGDIEY